ncbi:uncharacterized protein LOC105183085 isoform X2 [Harpegnathos saltator]|uniref:uncharacterized protein LOC105183085 isoform X2 n=1 Tax=Harpegnathos saltator TaxID=610380 RepID=UPI0005917CDA|nr:uncharacterized protein LOC105183085 isoform X2 [Harpegnathos saltator]
MSSQTTNESKSALVARPKSFGNIQISEELFQTFTESHIFTTNLSKFSKKQIKMMEAKANKLLHKVSNSQDRTSALIVANIYQNICIAHIHSNEAGKLHAAKDSILNCLILINDDELNCKSILTVLRAYGHLGYISSQQKKIEKAIIAYNKAIKLFGTYMEQNDTSVPIDFQDIIVKPPVNINGYDKLKNVYIYILESLIDLYMITESSNQWNIIKCRHMLLAVEYSKLTKTKAYFAWIERALKLCDYFLTLPCLKEAEYHILAIAHVKSYYIDYLINFNKSIKEQESCTEKTISSEATLYEQNRSTFILFTIYQARWGIMLLRRSAERLLRLEKDANFETSCLEDMPRALRLCNEIEEKCININVFYKMENKYLLNYTCARKTFVSVMRLLYDSKLTLNLIEDTKALFSIALNICKAYKYMALYEKKAKSQFISYKRRIEILCHIVGIINRRENRKLLKFLQLQIAISFSNLIEHQIENIRGCSPSYVMSPYKLIDNDIDNGVKRSLECLQIYIR